MSEPSIDTLIAIHELSVPVTVGRATISWNTLSGEVFALFRMLSELEEEEAKSIFFVVASDRSQRDMVTNLVSLKLKPKSGTLAKRANSILGEINAIAGKRNDILHVVYIDEHSPSQVRQFHDRGHLKGKTGQDLLSAINAFTIKCLDLTLDLLKLRGEMLELPRYQNLALAEAIRLYSAQRKAAEWASQGEYGLLSDPATSPHSSEGTQD
ncbi:hypothetical protein FJ951_16340 [Mesorhizobium sp. B2-2-3]|uniref:hypothetical protein n=1 Tax=Mesorhizobium sp. B2-2-3 TaxID=2589963 RepID=UPI00112C99CE|nr:hypothetical protein [Mesorhizobium sp. B2-2-3]TPM45414.1 hypothetical protein FJ951_16340 [Mesorhizobium sp. B2-2-3]